MFGLDLPSTLQFQMPDYKGDVQSIAGWAEGEAGSVFDSAKSVLDPVLKAPAALEQGAVSYISGGARAIYGGISDTLAGAASAAGSTFNSLWAPLASGLKWGVGIVIVGAAIYAFLLAAPFLPKPGKS